MLNKLTTGTTLPYSMLETAHDLLYICLQAMHVVSLLEALTSLIYLLHLFRADSH
jgi:hypothetical protein